MAMRKITINGLSAKSLRDAAKQVEKMQVEVALKNRDYVKVLTKKGIDKAYKYLTAFEGDSEPPDFATDSPYVRVGHREGLMSSTIRLVGDDVAFVEFGAGIHFNGHPNSSPNDYGVKLGYTIGSYGLGQGLNEYWYYRDGGEWIKSEGTEAAMPLFHASEIIKQEYKDVAREVFGGK